MVVGFAKWACDRLTEDADHFDLGRYVNKQNCCIWGTENPQACIEKPKDPKHAKKPKKTIQRVLG